MNNEELQTKLVPWFEWFHRHPELGHEEIETTAKIKEILRGIGVEIMDTGLKTGLIARIGSGRPVVALRCDIDALPVTEESGLPYASEIPGRMHACGHDFHTAAMLGAAVLLHERKDWFQGSVKLVFQPGEETASGSAIVLSTGALDDIEEIYGLHVSPELPPGRIGVSPGPVYAAVGDFSMRIRGKGSHAGYPHLSRDPIVAMGQIINAAQTIVSRSANPFDPSVVSITHAEGGNTWNVIPPEAFIEGTIRSLGTAKFACLARRLEEIVKGVELSSGTAIEYRWRMGSPAVDNDPVLVDFVLQTARDLGFSAGPSTPSMGGEDFALYQQKVKGVFWNIGVGSPDVIHHPRFIANPAPLSTASALLAALAVKSLERNMIKL